MDLELEIARALSSPAADIVWLQRALNRVLGLRMQTDGIVGPMTRSAIRAFQKRSGLPQDGIVGERTLALLRQAVGGPPGVSGACPARSVFVDCPPRGCPFEVLDQFRLDGVEIDPVRHPPKIDRVVSGILKSSASGFPVRAVLLAGHTDPSGTDEYNFLLSRRRAESAAKALCAALERAKPGSSRALTFKLAPCGERQPAANPALSRRVEVFLEAAPAPHTRARRVQLAAFQQQTRGDALDPVIQELCRRTATWRPARYWCFDAVNELMAHLRKGAPANNLDDPNKPFLNVSADQICRGKRYDSPCTFDAAGNGRYLVVEYDKQAMPAAVDRLKCALDKGFVARVGVLSGTCDDNLDLTCKVEPRWRNCPEHYLLVFGRQGDRFAFWDFSRASSRGDCDVAGEIGVLTWDPSQNRLTTATDDADMIVNKVKGDARASGFHVSRPSQKRYQVLQMRSGSYRAKVRDCAAQG